LSAYDPKRNSGLDVAVVGEAIIEDPILPDGTFHLRARSLCNPLKKQQERTRGEESP
jgi:hypothetical protein